MNRMSVFMDSNMQSIKRLSKLSSDIDFAHSMSAYGAKERGRKETQTPTLNGEESKMTTRTLSRWKVEQPLASRPQSRIQQPVSIHPQGQLAGIHLHHRRHDTKISDATSPPRQRRDIPCVSQEHAWK